MVLGAEEFFAGDRRFLHGAEFRNRKVENFVDSFLRRARIDSQHPGIGIRRDLTEHGVSEALLFANVLEQPRGHATAEKIIQHGHAEAAFVSQRQRRNADAQMDLLQIALGFETDGRACGRRGIFPRRTDGLQTAKFLFNQFENLLVGDVAGRGDENVVWRKPVLEAAAQGFAVEIAHGFRSAEDGAAERVFRPKAAGEDVVEQVLGIVQVHLDLFQNNLALLVDVVGIELGPQDQVGENVEGDGQVLVEHFGVEANLLLGGESVEHAADGIHFAGDIFGGAAVGALEDHVLQEMSQSVFGGDFAAGAVAHPDADRDGADVLHGLGNDNEAVRENVALDVADVVDHESIVAYGGGNCHESRAPRDSGKERLTAYRRLYKVTQNQSHTSEAAHAQPR